MQFPAVISKVSLAVPRGVFSALAMVLILSPLVRAQESVDAAAARVAAVQQRLAELGGAERAERLTRSMTLLFPDSVSRSRVKTGTMSIEIVSEADGSRTIQVSNDAGVWVSVNAVLTGSEWSLQTAEYFDGRTTQEFPFAVGAQPQSLLAFGTVLRFDNPQLARSVLTADMSSALTFATPKIAGGVRDVLEKGTKESRIALNGTTVPLTATGADVLIDDAGVVFFIYEGDTVASVLTMSVDDSKAVAAKAGPQQKAAVCRRLFSICIGSEDDRAAAIACAAWITGCQSVAH